MANQRHSTTIDVDLSTDAAEKKLAQLQAYADAINAALGRAGAGGSSPGGGAAPSPAPGASPGGGGGAGGGSGAAPSPAPGGGAPGAAPSASPGGGGGGTGGGGGSGGSGGGGGRGGSGGGRSEDDEADDARAKAEKAEQGRLKGVGMAGVSAAGYGIYRGMAAAEASASAGRQADLSAAGNASVSAGFTLAGQHARISGQAAAAENTRDKQLITAATATAAGVLSDAAMAGVFAVGNAATALQSAQIEQAGQEKAAALDAAGAAISFRAQVAARRGAFDQQNNMLDLVTGKGMGVGAGSQYGLSPEEAMSTMLSFGQAAGFRGSTYGQDVLQMSRSGASIGGMGAYRGLMAPGYGGAGQADPSGVVGYAQQMGGLSGSKLDDYLGRIAAATSQMAEKGLELDLPSTELFLRQLGDSGAHGIIGARATSTLLGAGASVRDQILGSYGNVVSSAVLGGAMRHAGGREGALAGLAEIVSKPQNIIAETMRSFGADTAIGGFEALGNSSATAHLMAGITSDGGSRMPADYARGSALAVAKAKGDAKQLGAIGAGDVALIEAETRSKMRVLDLAKQVMAFMPNLEKALDGLNQKVLQILEGL